MADQHASEETCTWGEPCTVERLRAMVQQLRPEVRASSTTLWAADEIERLRRENEALRAGLEGIEVAYGIMWCPIHSGVADELRTDGGCDLAADGNPCELHELLFRVIAPSCTSEEADRG